MSVLFTALPNDGHSALAETRGFTFRGASGEGGNWEDAFRAAIHAIDRRTVRVPIASRSKGSVRDRLAMKTLNITVFDSGQRLRGGTETAEGNRGQQARSKDGFGLNSGDDGVVVESTNGRSVLDATGNRVERESIPVLFGRWSIQKRGDTNERCRRRSFARGTERLNPCIYTR